MIAKEFRVPRQLIPYILRKGQEFHSDLFIIRHIDNNEHFSRFRVIISKKIHNKAVKRNKLRRQVYEAIRINHKEGMGNRDFILIPKKKILEADFQKISKDICENIIKQ